MYKLNNLLKTILKIIGFFLLLFIAAFYIFYGKYDLFRFPFEAEVWGNGADWAIVLVTTVTAIFLILTFREQRLTNELQIKKELEAILPIFKIQKSSIDCAINVEDTDYSHYLNVNLTENDARNLSFVIHNPNIKCNLLDYPYVNKGCDFGFELTNEITSGNDHEKHLILEIHFQDVKNNSYKQYAYISNNTVFFEKPILI